MAPSSNSAPVILTLVPEEMRTAATELSAVLARVRQGERRALEELVTLVYPELRRRAAQYLRRERRGHTLQPTALVKEAYLRLFHDQGLAWNDRAHFLAAMAQQMRRILVDYARARNAQKGPGAQVRVELQDVASLHPSQPVDLLAIDQALTLLAATNPRASRVVELRFFGGLVEEEAAEVLGISVASVKRDWLFARAWLLDRLETPFRPAS
jgi:RNA polymerase sigma factor (TIGR02999 family)